MHPPSARLRLLLIVALVVAVVAALPGPAAAAEPVTLQAHALVGGRFEAGGWAALSVGLENSGEPVSGYLAAEGEDGITRRFVELPAGSRKQVTLYLRPAAFARTVALRFEDGDGETLATASVELRVLERTTGHVAVVGDIAGTLRPQLIARASGLPEPLPLSVADFPERPEPLRGLETIVWAADSGGLSEAQRRALERWIASGGQLVVLGGPDWQARTAAFGDLLPVAALGAVDGVALDPLARWAGAPLPEGVTSTTAARGEATDDAIALVQSEVGLLAAARRLGSGQVTWFGVDLAGEELRGWPGAGLLWARVIPDDRLATQFGGGPMPEEEAGYLIAQALQNLPTLEVPPAELLLGVLVAYILLIGPVTYLVLRRLDRLELAWITAPILVLAFSAGTYGIGSAMKGSDVILNELAVIRTVDGGSAASVSTYAGVYSPTRASYDLLARADAFFAPLQNPWSGEVRQAGIVTEQGEPSRLRGLGVGVFGMQAVRADAAIPYTPALSVSWYATPDGAAGTVTNHGEAPMEDVAIVSQSGGVMIGTLAGGESRDFEVTSRNLNGQTASEQIYRLAGIDVASDAERRIAARRAIIDSLAGYGGVRAGLSAMGGIDRGPFVIGWRVDAPPVEISVEGHTVQHYSQAVEVLSSRPAIRTGPSTIEPMQMLTSVVSMAGDASEPEPGYVILGEGEVVFQLGLPIEAAGLQATAITILVGNDPGAIYYGQGFSSPLPSGYQVAVLDRESEAWVDLGDVTNGSRFTLENPRAMLDAAGRIQVRVTASDVPPEWGQVGVFVGARVEGVIAR